MNHVHVVADVSINSVVENNKQALKCLTESRKSPTSNADYEYPFYMIFIKNALQIIQIALE